MTTSTAKPRPWIREHKKVKVTIGQSTGSTRPDDLTPEERNSFGLNETQPPMEVARLSETVSLMLGEPTNQTQPPCFVPAEIPETPLLRAIDQSARFNGQGFFQNRRANRIAMLVPAHILLLELVRGGEEAIDVAISRFPDGIRERRPSRHKPELIAVQLTAKPENEAQRKLCSDYAAVLMVARVEGISVTEFLTWIDGRISATARPRQRASAVP